MPVSVNFKNSLQKIKPILVPLWLVFGVYITHFHSDVLFYVVAEMFTIIVGYGIFIFGYTTRNLVKEPYTQFLSVAFLFVISLDLVHLLISPALSILPGSSDNISMQLWLVARFIQAGALLAATWFIGNHIRWHLAWIAFSTTFWLAIAFIFYWENFPAFLDSTHHLTAFGFFSESFVVILFAATLVRLYQKRTTFDAEVFTWLIVGVSASALTEFSVLLANGKYEQAAIAGHLFKVLAFYAFYRAVVFTGITKPFALLFRTEQEHKKALTAEVAARTAELRASEERYRRLTERLPDLVYRYRWKAPRGYVYMNPATERITGYAPEEFYADPKLFFNITHPDDQPFWERSHLEMDNFPWQTPIISRITHKNGQTVWLEERIVPLRDDAGNLTAIEGVIRDVTAQKHAESILKQQKEQMTSLYRIGTILNASLDLDTVLKDLLAVVQELFHTDGGEVWLIDRQANALVCYATHYTKPVTILDTRMPIKAGFAGAAIAAAKTINLPDITGDKRYHPLFDPPDALKIKSLITVLFKSHQQIIGVLQLGSEKVAAFSEQDARFLETIAGIAAIAIENARLYRQAVDDAQTKLTLLKEVNHRVKNNLAAISGLLYLEKRKMRKLPDKRYEESIENLISRVQGLAAVHNLLSAGEWRPVLLKTLIGDIVRTTIRATTHKPVSVVVSAPNIEIQAEQAHHLGLIINELTINSLKHASDNTPPLKINVTVIENGDIITLTFRDNGKGYPPDVLQKRTQPGHIGFDLLVSIVQKNLSGQCRFFNEGGAVSEITFKPDILVPTTRW